LQTLLGCLERVSNDISPFFFYDRGYAQNKIRENVECEIMQVGGVLNATHKVALIVLTFIILQVVLQEAKESYDDSIVHSFQNDTIEQLDENVNRSVALVQQIVAKLQQEGGD
jgi:broad-specificity NMP kinase